MPAVVPPIPCFSDSCDFATKDLTQLCSHIKKKHGIDKGFACHICGLLDLNAEYVQSHILQEHRGYSSLSGSTRLSTNAALGLARYSRELYRQSCPDIADIPLTAWWRKEKSETTDDGLFHCFECGFVIEPGTTVNIIQHLCENNEIILDFNFEQLWSRYVRPGLEKLPNNSSSLPVIEELDSPDFGHQSCDSEMENMWQGSYRDVYEAIGEDEFDDEGAGAKMKIKYQRNLQLMHQDLSRSWHFNIKHIRNNFARVSWIALLETSKQRYGRSLSCLKREIMEAEAIALAKGLVIPSSSIPKTSPLLCYHLVVGIAKYLNVILFSKTHSQSIYT